MEKSSRRSNAPGSFLDAVSIDREPVDVLGRAVAIAYDALQAKGIELGFLGFDELLAVNKANSASWMSLYPSFNHTNGLVGDPATSFCLSGRNAGGDVVCTWACLLLDYRATTFADEAEALRLLFADPASATKQGMYHTADIPAARALSGAISYEGAGWIRPDFRRQGVMRGLSVVAKAIAASRWHIDYVAASMSPTNVRAGLAHRVGYRRIEQGMVISDHNGRSDVALLWMPRPEVVDFLRGYLSERSPRGLRGVGNAD
jgi:hypothetical protein